MATWVISTRKSFVVGSTSMSEYGKAAWHANGSVKLRTLLHATSALPKNKPIIWRATSVIGRSNESSDRKYWQRCSCILAPLLLLINVPILTAATLPRNASAFKFSGRPHLIAIQHHQKSFSK